jgi:hypothetical protein
MSLSCSCDYDDYPPAWWHIADDEFSILNTKHSRRCCSCKAKIKPGNEVLRFERWRAPSESHNYLEERIYGDEVPLASWYMCETCGGLYFAIQDLKMCCGISKNIAQQIKEYRR